MSTFSYDLARFIDFRDSETLARVRAIPRSAITRHPNPDFRIRVEDESARSTRPLPTTSCRASRRPREGRKFVAILPVGPMPQYAIAAR